METNLTLAITKVGDLLLNQAITLTQDGISEDNVHLSIPEYQRPYKWSARNAIQLLDDIFEALKANKEVYRVGTLILHKESIGNEYVYNIVDGQQRIITFSLLLYALYELEKQEEKKKNIKFLNQSLFGNSYNRHNIPNNLNAYRRRLSGRGKNENEHLYNMERLRDFIESQCELIVVITTDISEAFQFFDSQNARGKALYPHDLLKAYHLREMIDVDTHKTEEIVKAWEKIPQGMLSEFFEDYLYRIKEWINGNWALKLSEQNIHLFKGIKRSDRTPYAQFFKSAYSYAEFVNNSAMPFVTGSRDVNAFQLNTPIVAGKPFFDYIQHYYGILLDIRDNSKYQGFYVKGNEIVNTLDTYYKKGVGNHITRLLFDTSLLLYVDRFCPATYPSEADTELFEMFIVYAFVWAYSLRAQYEKLGWLSAQNYILERCNNTNSLNMYKLISSSDTPKSLLSALADRLQPLKSSVVKNKFKEDIDKCDDNRIYTNYIHYLKNHTFYIS